VAPFRGFVVDAFVAVTFVGGVPPVLFAVVDVATAAEWPPTWAVGEESASEGRESVVEAMCACTGLAEENKENFGLDRSALFHGKIRGASCHAV
jgi:hypothetical protein